MPDTARAGSSRSILIADGPRAAAARTPDKLAIKEGERQLTFRQLAERIDRIANLAHSGLGLRHGERVAILLPNRLEYLELVCGLSSAGLAAATIGPAASGPEIRFICEDSGARVMFVDPALADAARAAVPPTMERVIVLGPEYEDLLARAATTQCPVSVDERDIFSVPYTSGATGRPKGVMLSHRGRVLSAYCMAVEHACYTADDRAIATTPMFHGAGFLMALTPIFFGGSVEILPRFDIERLLDAITSFGATSSYMVPTHFAALFALGEKAARYDMRRVKAIISGTAPLAQAMKERIIAYFGEGKLWERYGTTETSIATCLRPADQLRKLACVGLPLPATHLRVLGDDGAEVPQGEVGELAVASPYMFSGYLNLPEATAKAWKGDWFVTGDLARVDEEGYVYLVDRKNDMIISGGENVYPREVEEVLLAHPAVAECAVTAAPHPYWGEAVTAFVVLHAGQDVTVEALEEACRARLSRYKVPKDIRIIPALPRNSMGKVLRRALRDQLRAEAKP
ncbi:MAG: AMP-binding protein [Alphaproteobacteria bacterium]|nr:AMP-binding protein [Alphaproteobacteria bacterium]